MASSDTHSYLRQESSSKLHPFIHIFNELWKAGETAHINLNTHAGKAWINIRTPLGNYTNSPKYPTYPPRTNTNHKPQPHSNTTRSPSYSHRQQRRKLARATNVTETNTNTLKTSAEQVELKSTHNTTLTEKVISQHHNKGNSAEKVESLKTHNTTLTDTNTNEADKLTLTLDSATPATANYAEVLNNTSESNTPNTETPKMSPEPDTMIPTTPLKITPIPSSTLLHHTINSSTPTTATYAEKLKHTIETITPNTEIPKISTTPNTMFPTTPLKTTHIPPPALLHNTVSHSTPTTSSVTPSHYNSGYTTPTIKTNTTLTKATTTPNTTHSTTNNIGRLKQQLTANLFSLNYKCGKKGNKSFNHY